VSQTVCEPVSQTVSDPVSQTVCDPVSDPDARHCGPRGHATPKCT